MKPITLRRTYCLNALSLIYTYLPIALTLAVVSSLTAPALATPGAVMTPEQAMQLLQPRLSGIEVSAPQVSSLDDQEVEAQVEQAIRLVAVNMEPPVSFDLVGYVKAYMKGLSQPSKPYDAKATFKAKDDWGAASELAPLPWDSVLLVDGALYKDLEGHFTAWVDTIYQREGRHVALVPVPYIQVDPKQVRAAIKHLYDTYAVQGVVLAGQWPVAFWACTIPDHPDWTHVGPLWDFYTDLDQGLFTLEPGDPATEGIPYAYNRYHRDAIEYPHDNTSVVTGEAFAYGPELWVLHWRATAVHAPMTPQDLTTERTQMARFLDKSVAFHRQEAPYWEGGEFLPTSFVGMCHEDYAWNCDASHPSSTAHHAASLGAGPYFNAPRLGEEAFVPALRQNQYMHLAFDVWTHAGPGRFWPTYLAPQVRSVGADALLWDSEPGAGALMTFIFGCSSGVFTASELSGDANYALGLIMSKGIDLVSVGTPWSIGFGSPYKSIMYESMIDLQLSAGQGLRIAGAEAAYQSWYWATAEDVDPELSVAPYLFFGDPYVRLPDFE